MFPQIFGKYVLEREIAAGGMARVYLATLRGAVGFEKRLVVKQIRTELASDAAFVDRFVEEAKTAVELSHPNIVPVYELGVEQGIYYIAMELCEGLTLSEVLFETGPLGPAEGAYVGAEICRALDYAHRRAHIVHRDVTPRNVLIDDEGAVRLIDFGIAAPVSSAGQERAEVFGSLGHMPPEQLQGAELSPRTDVFAVGVLLLEAWTGHPPFRRATAEESERALLVVPPRLERELPALASISDLIASCVALEPRLRPADAEQLARPLRDFSKSEDSGDLARRLGDRVQQARQRTRSSSPWLAAERSAPEAPPATRPLTLEADFEARSAAPGGPPITRTFAAREEVEVWTRKLSRAPRPGATDGRATARPGGVRSKSVALGLTLLAGAIATTGARAAFRANLARPLASLQLLSRLHTLGSTSIASSVATTPAVPTLSAFSARAPAASARRTQSTPSNGASAAPSAEAAQFGELKITADPPAQVAVSGAHFQTLGQSPMVGLKVPVGQYRIVFRNDTYGAPLTAQVLVVAGVSRGVHADFRQAEPAVSVR